MVVSEGPLRVPGVGELVVDVELVGLCGSDFHIYDGNHPYLSFPQIQGHEIVGTVRDDGVFPRGSRVVVDPLVPCDHCFACRKGNVNCCSRLQVRGVHLPGGLATSIVVANDRVHAAGGLSPELAVLVEPMAVALHAIARAEVTVGSTVLVIGAGSIGRSIALAAVDIGARVVVTDREPARLAKVRELGAERAVNSRHEELEQALRELFGEDGPEVVIDATGVPAEILEALQQVAHSGTIVIVGVSDEEVSIPVSTFTRKELNVRGSRNSRGTFDHAIALIDRHRDVVGSWISHRFDLADTQEALVFARDNPASVTKVVIDVASGRMMPT
ncbi:MAG: zinc-binding dehydrogenase [Microbacteriaceae bacterium]|nr:zinc-binding dehydrogenase [Microbacteriaceae bacterium]